MARILVQKKHNLVLNETFNIGINGEVSRVKIMENSQGLLRIVIPKYIANNQDNGVFDSKSELEYDFRDWSDKQDGGVQEGSIVGCSLGRDNDGNSEILNLIWV